MCAVSAIYDHHAPLIPRLEPGEPLERWDPLPALDISQRLEDFQRAIGIAKAEDVAAGTPDCFDPEKQKLEARVAELEKLLANQPEFVIVSGGNVEPGTYRVIDGKLYRAI
jgi:hypothetical protein